MAYRIACDGTDAATFYDDDKAYDYVAYSLSKDGVNSVTITVDNGAPVENPQQVVEATPQGPQVV